MGECQKGRREGKKWRGSGYRISSEKDEKLLKMNGGDGCTAMWMHLLPQKCTVKVVNSTLCIFYHN